MRIRNSVRITGLAMAVVLLLLARQAQATLQLGLNYPSGMQAGNQSGGDYSYGFVFTVGSQPITIGDLGAYDNPGNGLGTFVGTVSVALYQVAMNGNQPASGNRVGDAVSFYTGAPGMTLAPGTDTELLPFNQTLSKHTTYMIVAGGYSGTSPVGQQQLGERNFNRNNANGGSMPSYNTGMGVTWWGYNPQTGSGYDYYLTSWPASGWGNGLPSAGLWGVLSDASPRWTAGNFDIAPVPEVAAFGAASVGLLGLVYIGRCVVLRRGVKLA